MLKNHLTDGLLIWEFKEGEPVLVLSDFHPSHKGYSVYMEPKEGKTFDMRFFENLSEALRYFASRIENKESLT